MEGVKCIESRTYGVHFFRYFGVKLAWQTQERGELILAGALVDPADGAVLMFKCDTPEPVERFAATDPYVTHGLVTHYRVREWHTAVGADAFSPVRPAEGPVNIFPLAAPPIG